MDLYKTGADGNAQEPTLGGAETVASLHYVQLSGARPHIFIQSSVKKLIGNKIHTLQNA